MKVPILEYVSPNNLENSGNGKLAYIVIYHLEEKRCLPKNSSL